MDVEDDETRCRYCFEDGAGGEPLIAPCHCIGSGKYVHLSCMHKWQAHRLLEAASSERGPNASKDRFGKCEVCHAELRSPLPTSEVLLNLVRPGTGAALVAALGTWTLLVSVRATLDLNPELPAGLQMMIRLRGSHWVGSVFLLYQRETAEAVDDSDRIFGVNLSRELTVDEGGRVTAASENEVLDLDVLQGMVDRVANPAKERLLTAVAAARAAGATVKFFIGCVNGRAHMAWAARSMAHSRVTGLAAWRDWPHSRQHARSHGTRAVHDACHAHTARTCPHACMPACTAAHAPRRRSSPSMGSHRGRPQAAGRRRRTVWCGTAAATP